eukprot:gene1887-biopygen2187
MFITLFTPDEARREQFPIIGDQPNSLATQLASVVKRKGPPGAEFSVFVTVRRNGTERAASAAVEWIVSRSMLNPVTPGLRFATAMRSAATFPAVSKRCNALFRESSSPSHNSTLMPSAVRAGMTFFPAGQLYMSVFPCTLNGEH